MKVNFSFSFNSTIIKKIVNPKKEISQVLNEIIEEEDSLSDAYIKYLLCKGKIIDINKNFNENKIQNEDNIIVVSDSCDDLDLSSMSLNEPPFKFSVQKCITKHSHTNLEDSNLNAFIDRTFDVFKSLKGEFLLVYSFSEDYKNYLLISYNILQKKYVKIVKNAHEERVFTCSHFLDNYNKRDLLLTGAFDKKIKIWNMTNNFEMIYQKKPDYYFRENTYLLSENILSYNHKIYLTTSAYEIKSDGYYIFYYSLLGDEIGMFDNSKDNTNYLNTYYNNNIPYIVAANCGNIKIYNFEKKNLIKIFNDKDNSINYLSILITQYNNKEALISSSSDGILRIWNLNQPDEVLARIESYSKNWLIGLEIINDRYILAACGDGTLKEFDLNKNYVACSLERNKYKDPLFTVKYINILGEDYLFTHSFRGIIELWK